MHILRHLAPQTVYVSESLSGHEGSAIALLKGWVGHTILVVGDEATGGLADTETETETEDEGTVMQGDVGGGGRGRREKWYERSEMVGLGKEVEIVDASRVGEDWARRVGGRE